MVAATRPVTLGFKPIASSSAIHLLNFRIVDCYSVDFNFDIVFGSLAMKAILLLLLFFFGLTRIWLIVVWHFV